MCACLRVWGLDGEMAASMGRCHKPDASKFHFDWEEGRLRALPALLTHVATGRTGGGAPAAQPSPKSGLPLPFAAPRTGYQSLRRNQLVIQVTHLELELVLGSPSTSVTNTPGAVGRDAEIDAAPPAHCKG